MNSKILFVLGISLILGSACRKEFVCKCDVTGSEDVYIQIKNAKKKEAEEICKDKDDVYLANHVPSTARCKLQ